MKIKTTEEISQMYGQTHVEPTEEDNYLIKKKWIDFGYIRDELGLLRDAIKQGKPALPCVDVLIEEIDALSKSQADKKSVS